MKAAVTDIIQVLEVKPRNADVIARLSGYTKDTVKIQCERLRREGMLIYMEGCKRFALAYRKYTVNDFRNFA